MKEYTKDEIQCKVEICWQITLDKEWTGIWYVSTGFRNATEESKNYAEDQKNRYDERIDIEFKTKDEIYVATMGYRLTKDGDLDTDRVEISNMFK